MTLTEMLTNVARHNSRRVAIVEGEKTLTYAELNDRIVSLSLHLHALGTRSGDRIALLLPNGADFVISYFAVVTLGAVVVPLNDQYQYTELLRFVTETQASVIITGSSSSELCQQVMRSYEGPCQLLVVEAAAKNLGSGGSKAISRPTDPDAPVMYQFSSGSTGRPKRISRTHRNLLFELDSLVQTLGISGEDRFIGVTPFSHVNGLVRSMMASMRAGATLFPVPRFDRHAVVELIEKQRISIFIGVPFMLGIMAKTNYGYRPKLSSLRLCISASAPMPAALNRQFKDKFGMYVRQLYGSTETGTISANLRSDIDNSLESVGMPLVGVEVEIIADDGTAAQVDEIGELAVRSPAAIGSYGCDDLDKDTFRNGYFYTGDLGRRDQDGLLYLVGRKKIFINKGGYKINPREVEELLDSHPKVEETIVIGVPTPFGDQRVKAMIVTNTACSEEELIEYCRGKISDFKIPGIIEFRDGFPKSPTGKVRRELLS
jgi:long-chain acyl-CoA synthetase